MRHSPIHTHEIEASRRLNAVTAGLERKDTRCDHQFDNLRSASVGIMVYGSKAVCWAQFFGRDKYFRIHCKGYSCIFELLNSS